MARPKMGKPPKRSLNLTVDEKTRGILLSLSEQRGMSISALVEEWATKEANSATWANIEKSLAELFEICEKNGITTLSKEVFNECGSLSKPIVIPSGISELPAEAFPDGKPTP